jgi:thiosulfate dehydrogenase (quinone) large subunit
VYSTHGGIESREEMWRPVHMTADARRLVVPVAIVAAVLLFLLINPWFAPDPDSALNQIITVAFWILAIGVIVLMYIDSRDPQAPQVEVESPRFPRYLFGNTRAGLFWLPIRLFIGFEWLEAGVHKLQGTGWTDGGTALLGFWQQAVAVPEQGRPPISYDWYRSFIQFLIDNNAQTWMGWVIPIGECLVGLGLLLGVLTGFAAFFGALMNMSFLLAGSASTNPIMFTLAVGIMLAWKVAGYYGLDRWLLPALGVPWRGHVEAPRPGAPPAPSPEPPAAPATG